MLVGNKCDLRKDGVSSVPTSYGEKLAMVTLTLQLIWLCCSYPRSSLCDPTSPCPALFVQTYNTLFCETSAKDGSNTLEAVLHLAR